MLVVLFIALFIHFTDIDYSPSSKKLECNAGPYIYQQWLGKGFKEPWENVMRCIPTKCIPTNGTSCIKYTGPEGKCLAKNIITHVSCATK